MSRWYRRYTGTASDPKFAEAALVAECSKSIVIATWDIVLESAAESNNGGTFKATSRNVAATLQEPVATVDRVFAALAELALIAEGVVCKWQERQFESDTSTSRTRRHREKAKQNNDATIGNVPVAFQERNGTAPEAEAEADTETDTKTERAAAEAKREREKIAALPPTTKAELDELEKKLVAACNGSLANPVNAQGLTVLTVPLTWIADGADLELDILPTLSRIGSRKHGARIATWDYFSRAVSEAKAKRQMGLPPVVVEADIVRIKPQSDSMRILQARKARYEAKQKEAANG